MKPFIFWLFFPFFLLTACSSTALIDFQDYQPEQTLWLADEASQNGVTLRFTGIYALDQNVLFLYGGLVTAPGTLRSVLLRSTDSGRHWKEVMTPKAGSEITGLYFLEDGQGWAVVQWMIEGPGPANLYHSQDSGAHWQRISEFPLAGLGGPSYPCRLQFHDKQQGSIRLHNRVYQACCRYDTVDGGLTWQQTTDCSPGGECLLETPSEFSRGQMSWKFGVSKPEASIKISRRGSLDGNWVEMSKIPLHYGYAEGKIVLP